MKVLVFQNKKLSERIEQRKKAENELRKRIEQLENRQRTDDAVLMIVNRYWNQVRAFCCFSRAGKILAYIVLLLTPKMFKSKMLRSWSLSEYTFFGVFFVCFFSKQQNQQLCSIR